MALVRLVAGSPKPCKGRGECIRNRSFGSNILDIARTGPNQAIVMATVTRMDALLCGALGAILFRDLRALNALRKWLPCVASIALLPFAVGAGAFTSGLWSRRELLFVQTIGFSLLAVGFSSVILYAAGTDGTATSMQRLSPQQCADRLW